MRYVIAIVGIVAVIAALAGIKAKQIGSLIAFGKQMEVSGPPPEAVATVTIERDTWEGTLSAVGSVTSAKGVTLSNEAPGVVTRIHFESGMTVRQGQPLVELDTSVERAQLASAIARRDLAKTNAERTRVLVDKGALSAAQVDNDDAQLKTSSTDVQALEAQIAKKTVRAPFAGRLGIRTVNLGQYLNPGTPVTVLEAIDSVYADFTLPQQRLADLKVGMPVRVTLGTGVDGGAPIDGAIAAIDPTVDASTRTVKVRASLPNKDESLRPGMFVNVSVVLPKRESTVVVPATAIVHASYGDSVFVVEDKKPDSPGMNQTADGKPVKIARQQFVRLGEARGDFVAVKDGVSAGQTVVTAGAFKLRNNAPIYVDNSIKVEAQLMPRPENR